MFYFGAMSKEAPTITQQLGRTGVLEAWARSTKRELERPAEQYDAAYMARILPWMERFSRYFAA